MGVPFYAWIGVMIVELIPVEGIAYVGWAVLFLFFAVATAIRTNIRVADGIHDNMVEDFFAVMLLYPFSAFQMDRHVMCCLNEKKKKEDAENGGRHQNAQNAVYGNVAREEKAETEITTF